MGLEEGDFKNCTVYNDRALQLFYNVVCLVPIIEIFKVVWACILGLVRQDGSRRAVLIGGHLVSRIDTRHPALGLSRVREQFYRVIFAVDYFSKSFCYQAANFKLKIFTTLYFL